jgi:alanine racemase
MAELILHYPKEYFTQVDIHLDRLKSNYKLLKDFAGERPIMAVVKGDAYGHGLVECAQALAEAGAQHLGVMDVSEGAALRQAGLVEQKIYVLAGLDYPSQVTTAAEKDLIVFVYSREQLVNVMNLAQVRSFTVKVFLKIDTGMGRLGMPARDALPFFQQARNSPHIQVLGIATHLATISDYDAEDQLLLFQHTQRKAEEIFQTPLVYSALSGGAMLAHPEYPDALPRVGLALYGVPPPKELLKDPVPFPLPRENLLDISHSSLRSREHLKHPLPSPLKTAEKLKPVMRVASTIIQVKKLKKGETVSYDRIFTAPGDMIAAVVPFGYVHGLSSARSEKNRCLVRGGSAEQIGRICMNLSVYDVSGIEGVKPGDEAVFLGESGDLRLDAYQEFYQERCNPYEILCLFGRLNRRVHHGG